MTNPDPSASGVGLYLFTPSISALRALAERARGAGAQFAKSWSEEAGEQAIARLRRIEASEGLQAAFAAWKSAIEDPGFGVRLHCRVHLGRDPQPARRGTGDAAGRLGGEPRAGGRRAARSTPQSHRHRLPAAHAALLWPVVSGPGCRAHQRRLRARIRRRECGHHAAGRDAVGPCAGRAEAASVTRGFIDELAATAVREATEDQESHWEVGFEARELIDKLLAHFCEKWFGLSERGNFLQFRGAHLNWRPGNPEDPPCYPGHFMAPSRYTFQPHPGPEVERVVSNMAWPCVWPSRNTWTLSVQI